MQHGTKHPIDIIQFATHEKNPFAFKTPHPKAAGLIQMATRQIRKRRRQVLDTHLGSGSIAIACHDLGREYTLWNKLANLTIAIFRDCKTRIQNHLKYKLLFNE
jgi:predicted RNA methylase